MNWQNKKISLSDAGMLQEKFKLSGLYARLLATRGISEPSDVRFWLENDVSFLHNPFLFEDMELFCDRILQAIEDKEKVRVFGDRDVDGITSTALMVEELTRLGLETSYSIPQGDDPYGMTRQTVDQALKEGITLAVTVDCGISCFNEIDYATKNGMDVLVTDHHIATETLPPAHALIDPKVVGCGYPFADLAGCGVAAKCIWALRFAQTRFYKEAFILLHALPGNGTVMIEAARIENLIVTDRVAEEVIPGILPLESSRLIKFLTCNLPVLVLDSETELIQLRKAFPKAEISLTDVREEFEKVLPSVVGNSLFALNQKSKFAVYSPIRSELDTLIGLFGAFVRAKNPLLYKEYQKITDLVAIGTVSDLMPMLNENRILVKSGLKVLEKGERDSLRPFLTIQNLIGRKLSTTDVGWQISPLLNAAGRMGKPQISAEMLLCSNQEKAYAYAQELVKLNKERQKMGEEAWNRLQPKARKSWESFGSKLVLVTDPTLPRGISGIIATRLLKAFKAPSMVVTNTSDGRCTGSMRSSEGFNCHDFLSKYSDLFIDFGGHACAGGFSLEPDKLDELCCRISEDIDYMDCPQTPNSDRLDIDLTLSPSEYNENLISVVEKFEPYGEQNPSILFLVEGARIENLYVMNNSGSGPSHLKMNLSYGNAKLPAVYWQSGQKVGKEFDEGEIINVVFRLGRNYYRNQELLQLTILDIKRSF